MRFAVDRIEFVVDRTANAVDRINFAVDRTANVIDRQSFRTADSGGVMIS